MRIFFVCCLIAVFSPARGQRILIEDFEANNYDNWMKLSGFVQVQGGQEYSGAFAARLFKRDVAGDAQTTLIHKTFNDNWGIYQMACYVEGLTSDAQFIFQYTDEQNYYQVSCNPRGTDNPLLMLHKVVGGVYTVIDSIGAVVDLDDWFLLRVERYCDGSIIISIDGDPKIDVKDRSLDQPGTIGLAAWSESVYFDEVTFEPVNSNVMTELSEFVCSGQFYEIGTNRYSESGIFMDTLQTVLGCDSIIKLELTIVPHYLVTKRDTICSNEYYLFDIDTLRIGGSYNKSLQSIYGCDSLVELTLTVFGGDVLVTDTTICTGQLLVLGQDTILQPGVYFDTLYSADGCFSVIEQRVSLSAPMINLGGDLTVCFDETPNVPLGAEGFDSVKWFDGRTKETIAITSPGDYWVEVFKDGCSNFDTLTIAEFCEPTVDVYIPNGFSPDGDQINDVFIPQNMIEVQQYHMSVFNRWGSQIFQSETAGTGWDGSVDGKIQPAGVYIYYIKIDEKQYTGTITLIR